MMHPNFLVKSVLHSIAATMTGGFAVLTLDHSPALAIPLLAASLIMLLLVFRHDKLWKQQEMKTSFFFLFESLALAMIAWKLYQQQYHKATFLFEGVSIAFLCLAAFSLMIRKKRDVLYSEEDLK